MTEAAAVVGVFAVVLVIGLLLRQWSQRRLAELEHVEVPDPSELADPSRWPAPPPAEGETGPEGPDTP